MDVFINTFKVKNYESKPTPLGCFYPYSVVLHSATGIKSAYQTFLALMWRKTGEWVLYLIIKGLLSIRYRIRVVGLEHLTPKSLPKDSGILFLPNHPAELDPIIVTTLLWPRFHPRPLVV